MKAQTPGVTTVSIGVAQMRFGKTPISMPCLTQRTRRCTVPSRVAATALKARFSHDPDKEIPMRHDARMLLRGALIGGAAALWSAWIGAQTIYGVTETTPYTYLRGDRVR